MKIAVKDIAHLLRGEVVGDGDIEIIGPSRIEEGMEGTLTFLADAKYEKFVYTTKASAVLVDRNFIAKEHINTTLIKVDDVRQSLATLLSMFEKGKKNDQSGISPQALIDGSVELGEGVFVGPFAVIEAGCKIGDDVTISAQSYIGPNSNLGKGVHIGPGVKVYRETVMGRNCVIHANAVIGSDGFGFVPNEEGVFNKVPQIGNVVIGDFVEIGANTVIDRASLGSTVIESGVKLDNLIQIAHNVTIGAHTVIAAQAGIAGSTTIGKHNIIGGQVGVVGHISTADGVKVQAQSGIAGPIKEKGKALYGSPALAYKDYLKAYAVFKNLPSIANQLKSMHDDIKKLKQ